MTIRGDERKTSIRELAKFILPNLVAVSIWGLTSIVTQNASIKIIDAWRAEMDVWRKEQKELMDKTMTRLNKSEFYNENNYLKLKEHDSAIAAEKIKNEFQDQQISDVKQRVSTLERKAR